MYIINQISGRFIIQVIMWSVLLKWSQLVYDGKLNYSFLMII